MLWFILIVFLFFLVVYPMYSEYISGFFHHPILTTKNAFIDIKDYIKYKKYNNLNNYGYCNLYTAYSSQVFGCGKTLTMVRDALSFHL